MDIFKLVGSIFIDTDEANSSLKKTDEKASSVGDTLAKVGKGAAAVGTAVVAGATAAVGGITSMAKSTAESADEIDKMSQKLGLSREAYQEWDYVLSQAGVDINSMETGMKTLTNKIDDAKNGTDAAIGLFDALGISMDDVSSMSREDLFGQVITQLQSMEDSTERAALANDLFGKSGQNLIPLFNESSESTKELKDNAHELGLIMTDEAISAGVELTDTFDTLERTSSMLMTNLGSSLIPVVQVFADKIIEYMPQIQSWLDMLAPILTQIFDYLTPILFDLADTLMPIIFDLITQILPVFSEIAQAVLPVFAELLQVFAPILSELAQAILPIILEVVRAFLPVLQPILELLSPLLDFVMAFIEPLLELIGKVLPPLVKLFVWLIDTALRPLITRLPEVTKAFKVMVVAVKNILNEWKNALKTPINQILGFINGLIRGVTGGINNVIHALNRINISVPAWVTNLTGMTSFGFNLADVTAAQIPLLAKGGEATESGSAIVGEAGAELVQMPKGAKVTPLNSNNNEFTEVKELLEELCGYFRKGMGVYINGSALVGQLAPSIDSALGRMATNAGRRV